MAYTPNYYPAAYGNMYGMNQMSYQGQQQLDSSPVNWVQGDTGAKAFLVKPGSSVVLMDSESDHFYMKSVDMSGMPTLRKFKYEEVNNNTVTVNCTESADYISRSEFDEFKRQVQIMITDNKGGENE